MYDKMKHYTLVKKGSSIEVIMDTQVYCVPSATKIGLLQFPAGFFMNGTLKVLGQTATATVEISSSKGIAMDCQLDKSMVIYKASFFALSAADNKQKGPELSIATFTQTKHKVKEFRPLHFYFNGRLCLMGMEGTCYVKVSKEGYAFNLDIKTTTDLNVTGISGKRSVKG